MNRFAALAFLLVVTPVLADENNETTVYGFETATESWGEFTVHYPKGRWAVTKETTDNRSLIQLEANEDGRVLLQLAFSSGLPKEDPQYDSNPNLANMAALLPIALKFADNDESKIIMSFGTAALPEFMGPSSRVSVMLEEGRVLNVEACNFLVRTKDESQLALAIVMTESRRGQVQRSAEYINRIAEAFAIIQAIETSTSDDSGQ